MATASAQSLRKLYEEDETAWLEIMADLIARKQFSAIDYRNLSEYLTDMAKRDRREVRSRLIVLLRHLLKWHHQSEMHSTSWQNTVRHQRFELGMLLESKTLRNYAEEILADAYEEARKQAADETGLKVSRFPKECSWTIDDLLSDD
ncbi:MAG TPA: DUF29 domain-containing protein [Gemmataceae bacterium]|nr:DUF29 domain-containing protein [Gemmataceae bacterium]